jgi:hypothetical protein
MKVIETVDLTSKDVEIGFAEIARDDLAEQVLRLRKWAGTAARYGVGPFTVVSGRVEAVSTEWPRWARTDIVCLTVRVLGRTVASAHIRLDREWSLDRVKVQLTDLEREYVGKKVDAWFEANTEYVARQARFYEVRPWEGVEVGWDVERAAAHIEAKMAAAPPQETTAS